MVGFGTGAFGDMACHVLDPVYQSLKLGYPDRVQGRSTQINTESAPQSEVVEFRFPARDNLPKVALPEVKYIGTMAVCFLSVRTYYRMA